VVNVTPVSSLATLDTALPDLVTRADVIVEGRATVTATRDGHLGQITVRAVIAGVAPLAMDFASAPYDVPEAGVYFLTLDPASGRYRMIDDGKRIGAPVTWADAIGAAAPAPDRAVIEDATAQLADAIATFRAASGQPWSPSQAPAVEAAAAIFERLPIAGRPVEEVRATLGEPDTTYPDGSIEYIRHQGEVGVIRRLRVVGGRIVGMEIHLTQ
jgi:hypothetical protein